MSVLSLPLRGALSLPRPVRSRAYQVEGVSALVPGTNLRLPVLPGVRQDPAGERCEECAGTGVWFKEQQLGTCVCCDDMPDWAQATEPAMAGRVYQVVPGGLVPVGPTGQPIPPVAG